MNSIFRYILSAVILLIIVSCSEEHSPLFELRTEDQTGVDFINQITESQDLGILDYLYFYNGGGLAVGDINQDGLPDIYFTSNQEKNKLFLNTGGLKFKDITKEAGVEGKSSWNTGTAMFDANGDGLLDIYVCAVVGINGFIGHNELFINNGDLTFTEASAAYGLDFETFSSQVAPFDYDNDGDLDLYLLNHAIHTPESFGHADLRLKRDDQTGDRLLKNEGNTFVDVSEEAGIFGGVNGYGLGVAISDFNVDGFPDIYVSNDFHEDDYYYINNGDGTFREALRNAFGHISKFSMGNDVADINHDGYPDLMTLDMHAEDEKVLKASEGDEDYQIKRMRIEQYGYYHQFVRNMLQINQPDGTFSEVALMSGVASTDWSWSPIFADVDLDGQQDLFIANGILKRPNDLDYIKYVSNEQMVKKMDNTNLVDHKALEKMPSGLVANYFFKGHDDLTFENLSAEWTDVNEPTATTASVMADLDNDGDLDLVLNNLNQKAMIYENKSINKSYLKVKLNYKNSNVFGVGTKVYAYSKGKLQLKELFTSRGFQSSSEPLIHFGFGDSKIIDSLKIIWPDQSSQTLLEVAPNQTLSISPEAQLNNGLGQLTYRPLFEKVTGDMGVHFTHEEDNYVDFIRQKLIPYRISDRGPAVAVGDLNNDGMDDVYFGGSKFKAPQIFTQNDSILERTQITSVINDSIHEDVDAQIKDFNGDGLNDILVVSAGGDFYGKMKPLQDRFYVNQDSLNFIKSQLPEYYQNSSVVRSSDYDNDGDLDLFVANYAETNDYGKSGNSILLINDNGNFKIDESFPSNLGMLTDAIWTDVDGDKQLDLLVVGEWMAPIWLQNSSGNFKIKKFNDNLTGLWQSVSAFDIDQDGDDDYMLGNWGTNSKFNASAESPMKMYYGDFDSNGQSETIVCVEKSNVYYPILGLDELSSQLVFLKKKFNSYTEFAGKSIEEILDKNQLNKAVILDVKNLSSGYLKNDAGTYRFVSFKNNLQTAPIRAMLSYDFIDNGKKQLLLAGNYFGVAPIMGRFDAFSGALIEDEDQVVMGYDLGLQLNKKAVVSLNIIEIKNKPYLLVTYNNAKAEVYKLNINK